MRLSPNPFSDKLQIRLKKEGNIGEIEIYNLKGQMVTRLTSPLQKDNDSAYLWDGKDDKGKPVPAGVYIIKNGTYSIKTVKLP
jgi:flagellar hook assembly protein FlgD